MNSSHWMRSVLIAAVMMVMAATYAAAGVSDAWISTKVKMSLIASSQVGGLPIDVDTDEGRVTLSGKVPTNAEKLAATRIAKRGTGVVSVRNLLQVVPASRRKAVDRNDDQVKDAVVQALRDEPALSNSNIDVESVNRGVVVLSGRAASLSDHLLALEVANAVPGTRQVSSRIDSPDEYADREVWYDRDARDDHASDGNRVTDSWITAKTKMSLMTDRVMPSSDINVDTHRGIVTLFGTVPSDGAKTRAVQIARRIAGVHDVNDELRVVSRNYSASSRDDRQIQSSVNQRIDRAKLDGENIDVDVKSRAARLTGTVNHRSDIYTVVSIVAHTPGVERVVNDLRVNEHEASN